MPYQSLRSPAHNGGPTPFPDPRRAPLSMAQGAPQGRRSNWPPPATPAQWEWEPQLLRPPRLPASFTLIIPSDNSRYRRPDCRCRLQSHLAPAALWTSPQTHPAPLVAAPSFPCARGRPQTGAPHTSCGAFTASERCCQPPVWSWGTRPLDMTRAGRRGSKVMPGDWGRWRLGRWMGRGPAAMMDALPSPATSPSTHFSPPTSRPYSFTPTPSRPSK